VGKFYQQQAISPVASRENQAWHIKISAEKEGTATESFSPLGSIVFSKLLKKPHEGGGIHSPPPLVRARIKI